MDLEKKYSLLNSMTKEEREGAFSAMSPEEKEEFVPLWDSRKHLREDKLDTGDSSKFIGSLFGNRFTGDVAEAPFGPRLAASFFGASPEQEKRILEHLSDKELFDYKVDQGQVLVSHKGQNNFYPVDSSAIELADAPEALDDLIGGMIQQKAGEVAGLGLMAVAPPTLKLPAALAGVGAGNLAAAQTLRAAGQGIGRALNIIPEGETDVLLDPTEAAVIGLTSPFLGGVGSKAANSLMPLAKEGIQEPAKKAIARMALEGGPLAPLVHGAQRGLGWLSGIPGNVIKKKLSGQYNPDFVSLEDAKSEAKNTFQSLRESAMNEFSTVKRNASDEAKYQLRIIDSEFNADKELVNEELTKVLAQVRNAFDIKVEEISTRLDLTKEKKADAIRELTAKHAEQVNFFNDEARKRIEDIGIQYADKSRKVISSFDENMTGVKEATAAKIAAIKAAPRETGGVHNLTSAPSEGEYIESTPLLTGQELAFTQRNAKGEALSSALREDNKPITTIAELMDIIKRTGTGVIPPVPENPMIASTPAVTEKISSAKKAVEELATKLLPPSALDETPLSKNFGLDYPINESALVQEAPLNAEALDVLSKSANALSLDRSSRLKNTGAVGVPQAEAGVKFLLNARKEFNKLIDARASPSVQKARSKFSEEMGVQENILNKYFNTKNKTGSLANLDKLIKNWDDPRFKSEVQAIKVLDKDDVIGLRKEAAKYKESIASVDSEITKAKALKKINQGEIKSVKEKDFTALRDETTSSRRSTYGDLRKNKTEAEKAKDELNRAITKEHREAVRALGQEKRDVRTIFAKQSGAARNEASAKKDLLRGVKQTKEDAVKLSENDAVSKGKQDYIDQVKKAERARLASNKDAVLESRVQNFYGTNPLPISADGTTSISKFLLGFPASLLLSPLSNKIFAEQGKRVGGVFAKEQTQPSIIDYFKENPYADKKEKKK